jgi:hypothetical protein
MIGAGLTEIVLQGMCPALGNLTALHEFYELFWRVVRAIDVVMFHSHLRHTLPRPTET